MQARPTTVKSQQPFFLTILTNRVKKCSVCGLAFRDTENGTAPDYILGHMERDWYPNNGQWQLGKEQNKYYHLQKSFILQRCPLYRFPADFSNLDYYKCTTNSQGSSFQGIWTLIIILIIITDS